MLIVNSGRLLGIITLQLHTKNGKTDGFFKIVRILKIVHCAYNFLAADSAQQGPHEALYFSIYMLASAEGN